MTRIIETLREEHRNIEELLLVLEEELSVFDRNERPDYEVIQAVIRYFEDYPDCCHHPKEDMIFDKLKACDSVAAESVGDLEAEHQNEGKRLRRVAQVVRSVLTDHDILRQTFHNTMRDFIDLERKHMDMEERVLFSTAIHTLRPEDWAEIEAVWSEKQDSLFNAVMEERCQSLRERILQWERENQENWIAQRADSRANSQH
jgi:hemerythrin-like domain-containing protein